MVNGRPTVRVVRMLLHVSDRFTMIPGPSREPAMNVTDSRGTGKTTRHRFLGLWAGVFVLAGTTANLVVPCSHAGEDGGRPNGLRRPNIVILMADHVSSGVVAAQSQCLKPNLDRLAAEGVRFSRCTTICQILALARAFCQPSGSS